LIKQYVPLTPEINNPGNLSYINKGQLVHQPPSDCSTISLSTFFSLFCFFGLNILSSISC